MNKTRVRKLRIQISHPIFATPIERTVVVPQDFALSIEWLIKHSQEFIRREACNHYLWIEQTDGSSWFEIKGIISDYSGGINGVLHVQASEDCSEVWYE